MSIKTRIPYSNGVYFITFTCYSWLSLLSFTNAYDIIYHWFDLLKSRGHFIIGYVIMPNHVHVLLAFKNSSQSINTIVGNGKRFIGYGIIKRLRELDRKDILTKLEEGGELAERRRNKLHEIWEPSFDWKECNTDIFIKQKLAYMHMNPCTGKWNLSADSVSYPHSSAYFYFTGEQGIYTVTSYAQLNDVNLTD